MALTVDSFAPPGRSDRCQRCYTYFTHNGACCYFCGHRWSKQLLNLVITKSGVHQYSQKCDVCGQVGPRIRNNEVPALALIITAADYRCQRCKGEGCPDCVPVPCARCGGLKKIEWHHWAPRHLFENADDWPLSPLCQKCHSEWHRIVTPNMGKRKSEVF